MGLHDSCGFMIRTKGHDENNRTMLLVQEPPLQQFIVRSTRVSLSGTLWCRGLSGHVGGNPGNADIHGVTQISPRGFRRGDSVRKTIITTTYARMGIQSHRKTRHRDKASEIGCHIQYATLVIEPVTPLTKTTRRTTRCRKATTVTTMELLDCWPISRCDIRQVGILQNNHNTTTRASACPTW